MKYLFPEGKNNPSYSHGKSASKVYWSWAAMKRRCQNKNVLEYPSYGGRGITVCDKWQSFEGFYRDMGELPFQGAQLERIDNEGNYEPSNCRWATAVEQSRNRRIRKDNNSGFTGVSFINRDQKWRATINIGKKKRCVGYFVKKEDAVKARKLAYEKHYKSTPLQSFGR